MANAELGSDGSFNPLEWQRNMAMMAGESLSGHERELRELRDPNKVYDSIQALSAISVGLPVRYREVVRKTYRFGEGVSPVSTGESTTVLMTFSEAKQLFMSPDFAADKRQVGYAARSMVETALNGTGRENVLNRCRLSEPEINELLMITPEEERQSVYDRCVNGTITKDLSDSDEEVLGILVIEAPRCRARILMYQAFSDHQTRAGDEKALSELFVTPGHAEPQGVDFKEFFSGDGNRRDRAMRVIRAAGIPYEQLVRENKENLAIEGIHYNTVNGVEVPIAVHEFSNPYQAGWTDKTFKQWLLRLEKETKGDLFAIYDAWYVAIVTGVVAEVGTNYFKDPDGNILTGQKIGDAPLVSSLDQWLMHFWSKQSAEGGVDIENKKRTRIMPYKNKTGPVRGIGSFPKEWTQSFFHSAYFKKGVNDGKSVFDLWWNGDASHPDGIPLGEIDWSATDISQVVEEDVRLGTFNGWLYDRFQLWKVIEVIQGDKIDLKSICVYGFWNGIARTFDKGFKVSWEPDSDRLRTQFPNNRTMKVKNPDGSISIFRKKISDADDPRFQVVKSVLSRYAPTGALIESLPYDVSIAGGDRFVTYSLHESLDPLKKNSLAPGYTIESFAYSVISSGLVTAREFVDILYQVYRKEKVESILKATGGFLSQLLNNEG